MIPKKIHYCWFGDKELPAQAQKCLASWKKYCPDYQLIRWDESNFDCTQNTYTRWCRDNQKWAFLSDYVRLWAVAEQGGIYLDTDVELIRTPEALLQEQAFFGFENVSRVNTGQGFGAQAHHPAVEAMLAQYTELTPDADGQFAVQACPAYNTAALQSLGLAPDGSLQTVAGARILPQDWLNPYDDATGKLCITQNTLGIHWYSKSWISPGLRLRSKLTRPLHRLFGTDCFAWLKKSRG